MKKIYTLVAAFAVVLSANAQTKSNATLNGNVLNGHVPTINRSADRATGDTIMYFDGDAFYGANLAGTFNFANDDIDAANVSAALSTSAFGPTSSFVFYYELLPTPGDTNVYMAATSWFAPVGQADNWFSFGPVTIPAAGASLSWGHVYNDPAYRDGYEIMVSTTGLSNVTDFTNPAIFTVGDNATATTGDTVQTPSNQFEQRSVSLNAYAGQDIYVAVHHNATDMFILNMDDILIVEGPTSVNEFVNGAKFSQNAPNPFGTVTTINYELQNSAKVTLNVYDVTGKKVIEQNQGDLTAGKHSVKVNAENLAAGVYYYSLKVNENVTSSMKMVVVK
jgi:hypothetical protein